ncbi:MAG: hypothetical protein R3Y07_08290 [Eubacteriales bacterium]
MKSQNKKPSDTHEDEQIPVNLSTNPENRVCPKFDPTSIAKFQVGDPKTTGPRVVDNCAEDHIM